MTAWHAIVPLKPPGMRKTRLSALLGADERDRLCETMLAGVVAALEAVPQIAALSLLSADPPSCWRRGVITDRGRGLNAELEAARASIGGPMLVVHADLPELAARDVAALVGAALASGIALAPDRHGTGTNAVALMPGARFAFRFGQDSLARHQGSSGRCAIVDRPGLSCDVDCPADLDRISARFRLPTI